MNAMEHLPGNKGGYEILSQLPQLSFRYLKFWIVSYYYFYILTMQGNQVKYIGLEQKVAEKQRVFQS